MNNQEKFLVTGSGGFIGGWLVETLLLTGEIGVRAGIHNWSSAARLGRFSHVDINLCDILDSQQISHSMEGITCVIHCAKGTKETNVQGTQNLLDVALRKGIKRFVHLSTAEVYGNQTGEINERVPYAKTGNPYGDSKIDAEALCWEYNAKGLPVTVIRPSIVYGPFSKTWSVNIAQKLQSGNWGTFKKHGDGICNLIYISDLISSILMAARYEQAAGEAFNITGPDLVTWNQYFQRFNHALDLNELNSIPLAKASMQIMLTEPIRAVAMFARDHFESPIKQIAAKSHLMKESMKFVETKLKTSARSTDISLFNRKAIYVTGKAQELLDFKPKYNLDTGLQLTSSWLRQIGLVN